MKSFSFLFCAVLIAASLPAQSKNQEPKDFNEVISRMASQIVETNKTNKPQRLAVVTFISTKSGQTDAKNEFGEYLTESAISALNVKKNIFKLFERKRLDIILRENDLNLTDLVDQSQAKKVGELLPIDILLSGTYTKLKNYIDVNSRLLDVVTGEILVGFSGRIKMTADLQSLFPEETGKSDQATNKESELDRCKQKAKSLQTLLNDLSSDDKINVLVDAAVKIPFDLQCGAVHFDVMYMFQRYKIDHASYKKFLLNTLDTVAFPGGDDRATEIMKYFSKDGSVDRQEWQVSLKALKKVGNYRLSIGLRALLNPSPLPVNLDETQNRVDDYFKLARANEIGLPTPIEFNTAFFAMTEGLKNQNDNRLLMYCYGKYAAQLKPDNKTSSHVYSLLTAMYKNENDVAQKTVILKWLSEFFNQSEGSEKTAEELYDFARAFELTGNKNTDKDILRQYPKKDIVWFSDVCKNKFSEYATLTQYTSQREDRVNFCVQYGIPVPGVIPTMPEASVILEGPDWEEKMRVITLLEKMGTQPKAIEPALLKLLDARNIEHKDELQKIQESVLVILGHIRTSYPKAIEAMVNSLTSYESMLPDKATEALVTIGKESVPYLLKKLRVLQADDGGYQYKIIAILGRIGKDASAAKPDLQNLLQRTTNHDVKYAIEAALQAME